MIAYIRGELVAVRLASVLIETGGLAYEVNVPGTVIDSFCGRLHTEVQLYTYLQVKEDGIALFGFDSEDALSVFKMLLTVSGIGPKGATAILNAMSTDDLRFAVLSGDTKAISKCPGIGAKTAAKLILELKDKFKLEEAFEEKWSKSECNAGQRKPGETAKKDAVEALTALGYSPSDAIRAVNSVEFVEGMTTEDVLRFSLKQL